MTATVTRVKIELSDERAILSRMCQDTVFMQAIHPIAEPRLFESSYCRVLAGWAIEYYKNTKEAPANGMREVLTRSRDALSTDAEYDLIADFIGNFTAEWKTTQHPTEVGYAIAHATKWFRRQNLQKLQERLKSAVDANDPESGERLIAEFRRTERATSQSTNLMHDAEAIADAYDRTEEVLYRLPGAVGEVCGPFCRGDFIVGLAPPKRGKSWFLQFCSQYGALGGFKVLFLSLEMTRKQALRRGWQNMLGQSETRKTVRIPYFSENGEVLYRMEERKGAPREIDAIKKAQADLLEQCHGGEIRYEVFSPGTCTVGTIKSVLTNLAMFDNYVPDVVVVDYADLIAPAGKMDYRHGLDQIYKELRGIALDQNICVITASQTAADTLKRDAHEADASEDKRKLGHATKIIMLNQTPAEKDQQIMRLHCRMVREGAGSNEQVVILNCLDVARFWCTSRLRKDCILPDNEV